MVGVQMISKVFFNLNDSDSINTVTRQGNNT